MWSEEKSKIARRCGEKRVLKVKMLKNCGSQSTFSSSDVEKLQVSKSLWREAHFQVKMRKTRRFGPLFEVPMLKNCTSKSKC